MRGLPETARLRHRELEPGDLDFIAELMSHPEVMRFFSKLYSRADALEWVELQRKRYAERGHGYWLLEEKDGGRPVGQAGVLMVEVEGVAEPALGYIIHRPYWGRGYATESAAANRDYVFVTLDRTRVITLIRPGNEPSQQVARKIGMTPEKRTTFAGVEHIVYAAWREKS